MSLRPACLWILLAAFSFAGGTGGERLWTGVNGKTLRGTFVRTVDGGSKVELATPSGKFLTIALENLCEADRKLIQQGQGTTTKTKPEAARAESGPVGAIDKFKPDPAFNRGQIPLLNRETLQLRHGWAINSMATFIMWWDESEWIEVPRGRQFEDKVEWVYDRLERYEGRNTSVPDINEVLKGFAYYFDSRFEDEATYRAHLEYDLSPARLAQLASGPNACLLFASANGYGPYFAVLEAKPDGQLRLALDGKAIDARLVPIAGQNRSYRSYSRFDYEIPTPDGGTYRFPRPTHNQLKHCKAYELVVKDRRKLPEEFSDEKHQITVGHSRPLVVFRPYLFAEEGEKSPPPAEPSFVFPEGTAPKK